MRSTDRPHRPNPTGHTTRNDLAGRHGRSRRVGTLGRLGAAAAALLMLLPASVVVADEHGDAQGDELVVSMVGDGGAVNNRAVPVVLRELDAATGDELDVHELPTETVGAQRALVLRADADQQGNIQRSADGQVVTIGGYEAPLGMSGLNGTNAPAILRVVGALDAAGEIDTSTTLAGVFSERHIRGVVSTDGTEFWVGGHGDDGEPAGSVHYIERGGDAPTPLVAGNSNRNNGRVPIIHDGQLYLTSDRPGFQGLNRVGEGLPTTLTELYEPIITPPSGADVAHDAVFVGDHLYVTFTDGVAGIAKYTATEDGWVEAGTYPGLYWGLTGRPAGDDVLLYAVEGSSAQNQLVALTDTGGVDSVEVTRRVVSTAPTGHAYRGVAFAPGFEEGDAPALPPDPQVTWIPTVWQGTGAALGAVLGDPDNPVATGQLSDPEDQDVTLEVEASSVPSVADVDDVTVTVADGGSFTLAVEPQAAGTTNLTLVAEAADGRSTEVSFPYRVAAPIGAGETAHFGLSDASSAIDVGDGHFVVADDDSNAIRLFDGARTGVAVAAFEFPEVERDDDTWDLEASAQLGEVIYWVGSHGNTRSGNVRPQRDTVVATRIVGQGADTQLEYVGHGHGLRDALIDWDRDDAHGWGADYFGFYEATRPGVEVSANDTLNIEGAEFAPDGATFYLGFRSPLLPPETRDQALIVTVENLEAFVQGGEDPIIGEPALLDLEGRAIREIRRGAPGEYLIIGGPADDDGDFAVYGWDGQLDSTPVPSTGALSTSWGGSWESIVSVPSLADGTTVRLLRDTGTHDLYGDGTEAQDLRPRELMAFLGTDHVLDFDGAFGSPPPPPPPPTPPFSRGIDAACPEVAPAPFLDLAGASAHRAAIGCLAAGEIILGVTPTAFAPAQPVSREQVASLLARTYEHATGAPLPAGADRFDDVVPGSTHAGAIDALAAAGVIEGIDANRFGPRAPVTRAQAASLLSRLLDLLDDDLVNGSFPADGERGIFTDVPANGLGRVHPAAIDRLATHGIVQGQPDGTFGPNEPVIRQQIASLLARAIDLAVTEGLAPPVT